MLAAPRPLQRIARVGLRWLTPLSIVASRALVIAAMPHMVS
jgi:hypothetical protein